MNNIAGSKTAAAHGVQVHSLPIEDLLAYRHPAIG
jgi:hypothetical protein